MAKMKEYSKAYNQEAIELALSRVTIMRCQECGHPTIKDYCCNHCDSDNPTYKDQDESNVLEFCKVVGI